MTMPAQIPAHSLSSMAPVVGLVGGIGCGKTTGAGALVTCGYQRASFAHALKLSVLATLKPLGMEHRHVFGTQADKAEPIPGLGGTTGRRALELIGTEGYRAAYHDVWVKLWAVTRLQTAKYVFDDVRYLNEAKAIRDAGGLLIRLDRRREADDPQPTTGHASDEEWKLIVPDYQAVFGPGDLASLRDFVITTAAIGTQRPE